MLGRQVITADHTKRLHCLKTRKQILAARWKFWLASALEILALPTKGKRWISFFSSFQKVFLHLLNIFQLTPVIRIRTEISLNTYTDCYGLFSTKDQDMAKNYVVKNSSGVFV